MFSDINLKEKGLKITRHALLPPSLKPAQSSLSLIVRSYAARHSGNFQMGSITSNITLLVLSWYAKRPHPKIVFSV